MHFNLRSWRSLQVMILNVFFVSTSEFPFYLLLDLDCLLVWQTLSPKIAAPYLPFQPQTTLRSPSFYSLSAWVCVWSDSSGPCGLALTQRVCNVVGGWVGSQFDEGKVPAWGNEISSVSCQPSVRKQTQSADVMPSSSHPSGSLSSLNSPCSYFWPV